MNLSSGPTQDLIRFKELATHDLHFHYDGSVSRDVVARLFPQALALRHKCNGYVSAAELTSPLKSPEGFFRNFSHIFDLFGVVGSISKVLTAEFELASESGIKHLDLRFGCGALSNKLRVSEEEVLIQFRKGVDAAKSSGVQVSPTLCFSRHETMERAQCLKEFVLEHRDFIRAIDLEGPEEPNPTSSFSETFRSLRDAGLRVTIHAGEFSPASSIWEALDSCGAERLGHAFSAPNDAALMKRIAKDQIPVEVCLSSNYLLGLCNDLGSHPFWKMIEAGIPVVLCTDDQAMFGTTLAGEYSKAEAALKKVTHEATTILEKVSADSRRFAFTGGVS